MSVQRSTPSPWSLAWGPAVAHPQAPGDSFAPPGALAAWQRDQVALQGGGRQVAWPSYAATFGAQPKVLDLGHPALLRLVGALVAACPGAFSQELQQALAAGRLSPRLIQELQALLQGRGQDLGPAGVDGDFGPRTYAAAVAQLQALPPAPAVGSASAPRRSTLALPSSPVAPAPGPVASPAPPASPAPSAEAALAAPVASAAEPGRLALPPRAPGAVGGRAFLAQTAGLSPQQREQAILREVLAGNVPEGLRQLQAVQLRAGGLQGEAYVMPDYLAIGSQEDHVRIPMTPGTAQAIADRLGASLPTTRLVDEIHRQADRQLRPQPLPPGPEMGSNAYYQRHQDAVASQLGAWPEGALISGHKKDLVVSNRLHTRPGRVAIYGWHQANGRPIQPLSTVHDDRYVDYSHGVRLVAGAMRVQGQDMSVAEVLAHPQYAALLSDEGPIRSPRYGR